MSGRSTVLKKRYAIEILKANGCPEGLIRHCVSVSKNALKIASRVSIPVDKDLIEFAALLHDLGRCKTHGIDHAVVGAQMAREAGLGVDVANIIERHIGAGITASEAKEIGLPTRDFLPITPEEKIVSYADNITVGSRMASAEETLENFKKILGSDHPAIKRFVAQHDEITGWMKDRAKRQ